MKKLIDEIIEKLGIFDSKRKREIIEKAVTGYLDRTDSEKNKSHKIQNCKHPNVYRIGKIDEELYSLCLLCKEKIY